MTPKLLLTLLAIQLGYTFRPWPEYAYLIQEGYVKVLRDQEPPVTTEKGRELINKLVKLA